MSGGSRSIQDYHRDPLILALNEMIYERNHILN